MDPNVILLAGPSGAGKSTAAPDLVHDALHVDEFVNANVIARGLSAFNPEGVALEAGRAMRSRLKELAGQRNSKPVAVDAKDIPVPEQYADLEAFRY